MRDTAEKVCGHRMDMTNTTFIHHVNFVDGKYEVYFVSAKVQIIMRTLSRIRKYYANNECI